MKIRELKNTEIDNIKKVILEAFSREPWNDDWNDEQQFHSYIIDLIGNKNSLSLGLFDNNNLIGVSLGRIKHWYAGSEYWIDDLAIVPQAQGCGFGSKFIKLIEAFIKEKNIVKIVLLTNRDVPAYHFYIKNDFTEKRERVFFQKEL